MDSGSKSSTKGGDSGGPAYEVFENRLKLLGVLSHGGKHGYNFVHTYTNLYYFNNWLRCTLSPTEFSIKDLNEKKDADQYPCNDSSTLISVDNHEANEKKSCEKWQGWSLVKDEKSNYSACLPITKEACTAYADKTKAFHWDEKAKKCKHL